MSGVTDQPFRRMVRRFGAGLVVSEMIASREMIRAAMRMQRSSTDCAEEHPMSVQLAGDDPDCMAEAARLNVDRGAAIIDINFGCPAKKVVNKACGAALMRDEVLAGRIVEAVVRAVPIPVTVKMRLGWDEASLNAPQLARISEAAGARMVTVHGRTRDQFYTGSASWRAIAPVKAAVGIPVIANGDIATVDDAATCLAESGADGVMVGRGAQGRPWFIADVGRFLRSGDRPVRRSHAERQQIAVDHLDGILTHYGVRRGLRIARKHMAWAIDGLPGAAACRDRINRADSADGVIGALDSAFAGPEALAA